MTAENICPLPYPGRFVAAVNFVANLPPGAKPLSDEKRLQLFALHKQATEGPCKQAKPWGWNVVENAKWQSWSQLGNMVKTEAMRFYVQTLEEDQPDWWNIYEPSFGKAASKADSPRPAAASAGGAEQMLNQAAAEGSWSTPYIESNQKPTARYEHAVARIGHHMYIIGGNCAGGRYLNDVWIFDFSNLEWTPASSRAAGPAPPPSSEPDHPPPPPPPQLPPIAGHGAVLWENSILVVGGHVKSTDVTVDMMVWMLDPEAMAWSVLSPSGQAPKARGGHTCTLVGHKLYIFGGEDSNRRPLGDLHILDLESLAWIEPEVTGKAPSARSAHVAVPFNDRFVIMFGGGSVANCFNDLHILDTSTMEWAQPKMHGGLPSPRAGHVAGMLGDHLYIVGGGNNAAGCTDMAYLDCSPLYVAFGDSAQWLQMSWSLVGAIPERSIIASEGMSLISVQEAGVLVSFGGYNGKYSNSVSIFRPGSSSMGNEAGEGRPQEGAQQEAQANGRGEAPQAPQGLEGPQGVENMTEAEMQANLQSAWKESENAAREASAAKEFAATELALMRRQLLSAQTALEEKEKALEEAKTQLQAEQSKTLKLEAEAAELRHKLVAMADLEKELEAYRRAAQESQQKGSGLWGFIAGGTA